MRVIQITSPGKDEGKTVTALNLALTMAQEFQRRVLVIDTDLRRPGVHELLGLPPGPGLVDVLTGARDPGRGARRDSRIPPDRASRRPDVRPAGRNARLGADAAAGRHAAGQFDRIVIDSAPAIVADPGRGCSRSPTRLVLVVRAGSTTKPAIARAIQTPRRDQAARTGVQREWRTQQTQYARERLRRSNRSRHAAAMGPRSRSCNCSNGRCRREG